MFLLLLQVLNLDIQLPELGRRLVETRIVLDEFFVFSLAFLVLELFRRDGIVKFDYPCAEFVRVGLFFGEGLETFLVCLEVRDAILAERFDRVECFSVPAKRRLYDT